MRTRVVGIIPARYASQRLPAKPLLDLAGKPMIQRVYEQATKATMLQQVVVATDDERIASVVKSFGGEVLLTSPLLESGSDRVAEAARSLKADIVVNIQGDEPLIPPEMIDQAAALLLEDSTVQIGTLARRIESTEELLNPNVVKVVFDRQGYALYFSRSVIPFVREEKEMKQWLQHCRFFKHVGIYVYRYDFLQNYTQLPKTELEKAEKLEQLRILEHGYRIKVAVTEKESIAVDTLADAEVAIQMLLKNTE